MEKKLLRKIVIFLTLVLLFSSVYAGTNIAESTNASSQDITVLPGNIIFTGNVTNDFAGHLIATNTHATFWGSNNNISQLYVAFNTTYLFIGIKAVVDGNALMVFLSNNTNSGYGTYNMTKLNTWARNINFTAPMNYFAAVWFSGLNSGMTGMAAYMVNSTVSESNTSPYARWIPNYFVFNGTNDTTEIEIPWTAMFPYGHSENLVMNISVFIVGGSGPWVGIGIPYAQKGIYSNGNQAEFTINNTIPLDFRFFSVNFEESGLPANTTWYVNISSVGSSGPITGASYSIALPNGTYSYTIATVNKNYAPSPSSGTFTVNGANVSQSITFSLVTYTVTFTESGLPTGTTWYVNLSNGKTFSSSTNTISFSEPNGTYLYTVATVNKNYAPSPSSGTFTVNGANVQVSITFSFGTFTVTFIESGLPAGTTWYVNLSNGQTFSQKTTSLTSTITFLETHGIYFYTITTNNKMYKAIHSSGMFVVNGASVSIPVKFFEVTYTVVFFEIGLPSGTTWYVNLSNGQTFSSTKSIIVFNEPNGTYTYTIGTKNGDYTPTPSSGTFIVNGGSVVVLIKFNKVTTTITKIMDKLPSGKKYMNLVDEKTFSSTTIFSEVREIIQMNTALSNKKL